MTDQPKTLAGSNDLEKFTSLAKLTHKQQAIWFLNGMWSKGCGEDQAEAVWQNVQMYAQLDLKKKADGKYVVNSPQGGDDAEIDRAQAMLAEAQAACDAAVAAAKVAEQKAEEARGAEAPLKAAEEEVKSALAEVQAPGSPRD